MDVCLMIEGQEDVSWDQWLALARACEAHGFEGLFRSDHYLSVRRDAGLGSLDAWTVLAGLAVATDRIRMQVLEEQLHVVHGLWSEGDSYVFEGLHYRLEGARALPKPLQQPHPPIIVGGSAGPWSARLAAQFADEYNVNFVDLDECRRRRDRVAASWEHAGRDPASLRFSLMTGCLVGADEADLRRRAARLLERTGRSGNPEAFLAGVGAEWVVGTSDDVVARLKELEAAGVRRVMLQHLVHDDLESVALIGREVIPRVA